MEVMTIKVTLIIPKQQMLELLRWVQVLKRFLELDKSLYGGDDIGSDLNPMFLIL
jgi:hypothetical protein